MLMIPSRSLLIGLLLTFAIRAVAQPVTIHFRVGSELATEMTGLDDDRLVTAAGPYEFKDIKRVTFSAQAPDSTVIRKLQAGGVEVYIKSRKVTADKPRKKAKEAKHLDSSERPLPIASVGFGGGLDFGGLGMRFTMYSASTVSCFLGGGYNFNQVGINGGLDLNFTPHNPVTGFLSAMYGYNGVVIQPTGSTKKSETFYGPSIGLGIKSRAKSGNYISFQLIFPIREQAFFTAAAGGDKPWPVLFSFGFHFQ